MTVAEYIVTELIKAGTEHAFGIPGGVILRLLIAMKRAEPSFMPHLCYHEQDAGFAALGYAQASSKLGVAYATRGPGITNMVTCIAEAYQESLPVLFITAHGQRTEGKSRFNSNQELDIVSCVSGFTKFTASAESPEEAASLLKKALCIAQSGRKGPVLIDFSAAIFGKEIAILPDEYAVSVHTRVDHESIKRSLELLSKAKRPLLLIGDGLRFGISKNRLAEITDKLRIPVLSSRGSQDLLGGSRYYFGYVGSHGVRYSNFILSKADLIIAVGNRMAFPLNSASFSPVVKNARVLRIDIDENEFERHIPNELAFVCDGGDFLQQLCSEYDQEHSYAGWLDVCRRIKSELLDEDCTETILRLSSFISRQSAGKYYVCDVGNNEFLFSRAYERSGCVDGICCSKSFGTLGSAIGHAIGAYYAVNSDVICVCGDQGFQYNIQELQYISHWKLPIKIVLLNNNCSGMIKDHQRAMCDNMLIHVDSDSGYSTPDFKKITEGYGISFVTTESAACDINGKPMIYEIRSDGYESLRPCLPKGNPCQDMYPALDRAKYEYLDNL